MNKRWPLFLFFCFFISASDVAFVKLYNHDKSMNPCTRNKGDCYSIQGEYSQPGCPGQRIETVEIDNHSFFLGCTQ